MPFFPHRPMCNIFCICIDFFFQTSKHGYIVVADAILGVTLLLLDILWK